MSAAPKLTFRVYGTPQPGGSKRAFPHRKTGRIIVTDDNKRAKPWMQEVAGAAIDAISEWGAAPVFHGPVALEVEFVLARPKGHYGTGKNAGRERPGAPLHPAVKPDATKLLRALEDALTGIVWRDDAQVVEQTAWKTYGSPEGAHVTVIPLAPTIAAGEDDDWEWTPALKERG